MKPAPGDLIGTKYRIVRLIGDGGMGSVYEARHEVLGTAVALKFLHSELTARPGLAQRFLQEARVAAAIQSPHVARVTDVDTAVDGSPYLVMELLHGESLQHLMDRTPELATAQAIDFALQILSGLEVAHAADVVHRDLKPDNVFITPSSGGPILKLIDFGIAKLRQSSEMNRGLTRAGVVMGTPEYMPPEQLYSANAVDQRADLYAVGVMLFEMLAGRRPADGDEPEVIVGKVLSGEVLKLDELKPDLPPGLVAVVHKALAADRDARYANALEMRLALAPFATELSHAGRLAAVAAPALAPPSMIPPSMLDGSPALVPPTTGPRTEPGQAQHVGIESTTEAAAPPVFAEPRADLRVPTARAELGSARPGRPTRWGRWLAAFLLVAGAGTAAAFGLYYYEPKQPLPPPPLFTATATPDTTVDPLVNPPSNTATATSPTTPVPASRPPSSPGPSPADAGVTGPPAATVPPFGLPSTFPPVTFPPLPTGFPSTFPPLPGIFPPPATAPSPTPPSTSTPTPTTAPAPTPPPKPPTKKPPTKPGL